MSTQYTKMDKLGEGTYGIVYKAKCKATGTIVALKRVRLDGDECGVPCTTVREVSLLKELKHPNIVKLLEVCGEAGKLTLVFEYVQLDLKKYIDSCSGAIDAGVIQTLFRQLLLAVEYCHARFVLHRDLKPQNLLVDPNTVELRVADFGLGRAFGVPVKKYTHEVVTLWYRSPDILLGSTNYGAGVDLWSCGCILGEMVRGRPLIQGRSDLDQLLRTFRFLGRPRRDALPALYSYPHSATFLSQEEFLADFAPPECDALCAQEVFAAKLGQRQPQQQGGAHLMRRLLEWEPALRISAADAARHPYFRTAVPSD